MSKITRGSIGGGGDAGAQGGRRGSSFMGAMYDIGEDAKILKNTSEITLKQAAKDHDCYWKSHDAKPHEIIYDFGRKVSLTSIQFTLLGCDTVQDDISYNPKCVSVSYTQENELGPDARCSWLPAKRVFCPKENEDLEVSWRCEEPARYWRVEFQLAWEKAPHMIISACKLMAEDAGARPKNSDLKVMSKEQTSKLTKMAQEFDMEKNLPPEIIEVRALAKKVGVSVDDAEMLRAKFNEFDVDGSGFIDKDEFKGVLKAFMGSRNEISKERFDAYWRDVDQDNSGEVDFEEFLKWYQVTVKTGGLSPEGFYATFGLQRLGRIAAAEAD
ncbi:unnamed protein product [Amoebophrya sp. A120]|nr:unnamed protein product [Amoebophrya sp. A120]|eukprot:GSA120T00018832001.1